MKPQGNAYGAVDALLTMDEILARFPEMSERELKMHIKKGRVRAKATRFRKCYRGQGRTACRWGFTRAEFRRLDTDPEAFRAQVCDPEENGVFQGKVWA